MSEQGGDEEPQPATSDDHDETNELYNLSAEEEAADEMEAFLDSLEKTDIGEILKKDLKKKLEFATTKLSDLFKKQQELNAEEEEIEQIEVEKDPTIQTTIQTAIQQQINDEKTPKKQDNMKQLMLQKKVQSLNNQVELADQKSRSVTIQWALDKEKFRSDIKAKQAEIEEINTRLVVIERKSRLQEQMIRDNNILTTNNSGSSNNIDNNDIEKLKEINLLLQQENNEKKSSYLILNKEFNQIKSEYILIKEKNEILTHRIEELVKNSDHMNDHIELKEKEDSNISKQLKNSLNEIIELNKELSNEKRNNEILENKLKNQEINYNKQIDILNSNNLNNKINDLNNDIQKYKELYIEKEKEIKKINDFNKNEKEIIQKEKKEYNINMNKLTYIIKTINNNNEIYYNEMNTILLNKNNQINILYNNLNLLKKNINNINSNYIEKIKKLEILIEQLKQSIDHNEIEYNTEITNLNNRISDLLKDLNFKEKNIQKKISLAIKTENENNEKLKKELNMSNLLIDKLNKEIDLLNKKSIAMSSKEGTQQYIQEIENNNKLLNTTITELKTELLEQNTTVERVNTSINNYKEELEQEREKYNELKLTYDHILQQHSNNTGGSSSTTNTSIKNIQFNTNPTTTDTTTTIQQQQQQLYEKEKKKLHEEIINYKKEITAKNKEIKLLQKERNDKITDKGVSDKVKSVKASPHSTKIKKPKSVKTTAATVLSDSDSDLEDDQMTPPSSAPTRPHTTSTTYSEQDEGQEDNNNSNSTKQVLSEELEEQLYERFLLRQQSSISSLASGCQTEPAVVVAKVDKKRIEDILQQAVHTDNYYYSKQTGTFTNVYPVEQHLMDDLVDAFHSMSQDLLGVMRAVTGHGVSLLESSMKAEPTPEFIVENIEAIVLKASKDLIINMEKSKERGFKQLLEEQRGKLENLTGAVDSDIAYAKEEAVALATEAFQKQLQEVVDSKKKVEDVLEETQDLLAVERARVVELTLAAEEGGFQEDRGGFSDEESLGSLASEESLGEEGEYAEEQEEGQSGGTTAVVVEDGEGELSLTNIDPNTAACSPGADATSGKSVSGSFKAVASAKVKMLALRKSKEKRKKSKQQEDLDSSNPDPSTTQLPNTTTNNTRTSSKSHKRRSQKGSTTAFDDLDTGEIILKRLTSQQVDELKTLILLELKEEVKQNLQEIERIRVEKEAAVAVTNHHVSRDVHALKEDLLQGKLQHIGEVRVSDFDRLRNKLFGPDDLISLTIVEHHIRYGGATDAYDTETEETVAHLSKEEIKRRNMKRRQYRMLIRSMVLQRELLQKNVVTQVPLLELLRYKHATETGLLQLTALSAWRALNYYRGGGVFRDVLVVHLEVIDKCIAAAGGWRTALEEMENSPDPMLDLDTAQWPEFFRVRVLEMLRCKYAEQLEHSRVRLLTGSLLQQQQQTPVEYIQNNSVLPFDQTLTTEANKKRMDSLSRDASSRAVELMDDEQYSALNRSVKKLKVVASASMVAYHSSREDTAQQQAENASRAAAIQRGRQDSDLSDTLGFSSKSVAFSAGSHDADQDQEGEGGHQVCEEGRGTRDSFDSVGFSDGGAEEGAENISKGSTMSKHAIFKSEKLGVIHENKTGSSVPSIKQQQQQQVGLVVGDGKGTTNAGSVNSSTLTAASPELASNPLMPGKMSTIGEAHKSAAATGRPDKERVSSPNAWLLDEDVNDSVGSSELPSVGQTQEKQLSSVSKKQQSQSGGAGRVHTGKDKTTAGTTEPHREEDRVHDQSNDASRPNSPTNSVISNITASTTNDPSGRVPKHSPYPTVPATTKAQQLREQAKKRADALKFSRFDTIKHEEKKKKAAKAAETTAANQKAAGENMASLAQSIGDMFTPSDEEFSLVNDGRGSIKASMKYKPDDFDVGSMKSGVSNKVADGTAMSVSEKTVSEPLQWMHNSADQLVVAALYRDEHAIQLMNCIVDSIHHWETGQPYTGAVVLKAAMHLKLVPELVSELLQRTERRVSKIPAEVLEIREKFVNIISYLSRLAQDHEQQENLFLQLQEAHQEAVNYAQQLQDTGTGRPHINIPLEHPGYRLDAAPLQTAALSPHLPVHHAHSHGGYHPSHSGHGSSATSQLHSPKPQATMPLELQVRHVDPTAHPPATHVHSHSTAQNQHSSHGHHAVSGPHSNHLHHPAVGESSPGPSVRAPTPVAPPAPGSGYPNPLLQTQSYTGSVGTAVGTGHSGSMHPSTQVHIQRVGSLGQAGPSVSFAAEGSYDVPPHQHTSTAPEGQSIAAATSAALVSRSSSPPRVVSFDPSTGRHSPSHSSSHTPGTITPSRRTSIAVMSYNTTAVSKPMLSQTGSGKSLAPFTLSGKLLPPVGAGLSASLAGGLQPFKPAAAQMTTKKRVAMFDNCTQTAHGSIQLREIAPDKTDEPDNLSSLVKSLMLIGWEDKVKMQAKKKKITHTIITAATATPHVFPQGRMDPFAHQQDAPTVFRGFEHAYFDEAEFEVLPGVRLASAHRVASAIRAHMKTLREQSQSRSSVKVSTKSPMKPSSSSATEATSADLSHEDDLHIGSWTMATNIRYCIRSDGAEYGKRLKRVPFYVNAPVVPGCEAVIFPNVFPVQQGVNLITGEKSSMGQNLALPEDVLLLQVAEDTVMPPGLTQVELSPVIKLSSSLQQYMQRTHPLPAGHHLVQLTEHSAVSLPDGVEVRSGVTVVATPPELDLPSNVIVVKNPQNDDLPSYMHKVYAVTNEEDDLIAETKLNEFCCVVKRPAGIGFGLGVEILQRPPGHPLPPGMTLLSVDSYPDGLVLPEELELVQLTPRFDFPSGCRLNSEWKVWPRPDGMRLPPGVQLVYPDSTAAVPPLPMGVCPTNMPDIPYGATLPPNTIAVDIFGSASGRCPLPEGAILAPGIIVLSSDGLIPPVGVRTNLGSGSTNERALNVLLVHRMAGAPLPPLVERGSKADLPVGTLLAENMDIVRVAVRFELPAGVRIQAGAKLGPFTQIAPGTDLVTLSGGKPDDDYSCTISVLEWPHGVRLTPGTEFVRRPPAGYYLPVGYKEVVQPRDVSPAQGVWLAPPIPEYGMLVELPRAIHYATAQNLAEQVTVGLESLLEGKIVTIPLGMVLASRTSKRTQWPAEMTPAPASALNVSLVRVVDRLNSENGQVVIEGGATIPTFDANHGSTSSLKAAIPAPKPALHVEVVKLRPHYSLPPGCEIVPGLVVQRKPFWLHVPSGVELVTKYTDASGHPLPFPCKGVTRINLRPDFILTGAEVDMATDPALMREALSSEIAAGQKSPQSRTSSRPTTQGGNIDTAQGNGSTSRPTTQGRSSRDWELVDLEHTVKLSPTSLSEAYELVYVSELLEAVHSWGPYLKGVEAVNRSISEAGHPVVLPPWHFLIQRPLIPTKRSLPPGFQLSVSHDYSSWEAPPLPPSIEVMHLVPTYHLPMGINIMNTSVLNKNQFNTARARNGMSAECMVPELQAGEKISAGFSVVAKPFGSVALSKVTSKDPFYVDEAHAFVRVHDPRHFKLPKMMTLDRHSADIVEAVFGKELLPAWRQGYLSKHDIAGAKIASQSDSIHKPSPAAALQGDLMITDIIKFVRLPHGFPAPRERQKRAQHRFALLKPAAQKIQTIIRMRGGGTKLVTAESSTAAAVPSSRDGTRHPVAAATPPQHTHTHHRKQHNSTGLMVYPRLLCIHKRETVTGEDAKDKFLTNVLLHRLTQAIQKEAVKHTPTPPATTKTHTQALISEKETESKLLQESLHSLQDTLESEHTENVSNKEKALKLEEENTTISASLQEVTAKNAQYEKQLSYDEDLKVLIQRLNLKLQARTAEIDEITRQGSESTDRLQIQVDLLTSQVAYYQDLSESLGANKSFIEPSGEEDAISAGDQSKATSTGKFKEVVSSELSLDHFEKFSVTLHQKYREQLLAGLEHLSELYARSVDNIMTEFENILMNWPRWSPKQAMTAAISWCKGHPIDTVSSSASSIASSSATGLQGNRTLELRIPSADDGDTQQNQSIGLTPPKLPSSHTGFKVRAPYSGSSSPIPFNDEADEDISVLSDGEASSLVAATTGSVVGKSDLHSAAASVSSLHTHSVSNYQPRDLTKDASGRVIPVTTEFALNVKNLYTPTSEAPTIDMISLTLSPTLHHNANNFISAKVPKSMSKSKAAKQKLAAGEISRSVQQLPVSTPAEMSGQLELSHSLNDLFAKQRRTAPGKVVGKLPKLIRNTTLSASARGDSDATLQNIRYLDPAVLGAGVVASMQHGQTGPTHPSSSSVTSHNVVGGSVVQSTGTVGVSGGDGMTLSADLTAREVVEFLQKDEHRREMRQKLQNTTGQVVSNVRRDFTALLTAVHTSVMDSIPKILEQYKTQRSASRSCSRGGERSGALVEDYTVFSTTVLTSLQSALDNVILDSTHYMKYALSAVLLHSHVVLQQVDIESDALRHQLSIANKRLEVMDYLLQDARRKGTEDTQHTLHDALKEKVLSLESRLERVLEVQIDPAISVLSMLVQRLQDLDQYEKQLKFSALLFKQKSAKVEARLQLNRELELHPTRSTTTTLYLSESEDEEDDDLTIGTHVNDGTSSVGSSVRPTGNTKTPKVRMLDRKDIKARKYFAHNARMKAKHCHARAQMLRDESKDLTACIMDHIECYQRAAQKLLPPHLLEQVLRSSVRKYQDISAGMHLARAQTAAAAGSATPKTPASLSRGSRRQTEQDSDQMSLSESSLASSMTPTSTSSLALSQSSATAGLHTSTRTAAAGDNYIGSGAGGSVRSGTSSVVSGSGSIRSLQPIRGTEITLQRSMLDSSRHISQSGARYGAAGSMPLAPTQSHLLMRNSGKKNPAGFK